MLHATPARGRQARRGFTLPELIIVMLLMIIVMSVAGSLISSVVQMYTATAHLTVARNRAQDVFNVLKPAMQNAGLGIPAHDFDYYFSNAGMNTNSSFFLSRWDSPVGVTSDDSGAEVLRVVYSMPTSAKVRLLPDPYAMSSVNRVENTIVQTNITAKGPNAYDHADATKSDTAIRWGAANSVHSFITFPGMDTHPSHVQSLGVAGSQLDELELGISGISPKALSADQIGEALPRNMIGSFADLNVVRAGVAFVSDGTFYMLDADTDDPLGGPTGASRNRVPANIESRGGFRVEGIAAVRFFPSHDRRSMTVWVLAEGAGSDAREGTGSVGLIRARTFRRRTADGSSAGAFETVRVWDGVDLEDGKYYEDFFMTWRMRNLRLD